MREDDSENRRGKDRRGKENRMIVRMGGGKEDEKEEMKDDAESKIG